MFGKRGTHTALPPKPLTSPPEWGAAAADMGDEGPLQGPALAPYGQATEEGE